MIVTRMMKMILIIMKITMIIILIILLIIITILIIKKIFMIIITTKVWLLPIIFKQKLRKRSGICSIKNNYQKYQW